MDERTRVLRIGTALLVLASLLASGLLSRSPWLIVVAAPILTVLYALGRWRSWRHALIAGGVRAITLSALVAFPIQAAVAAVLYLIGLGLSRFVFGSREIVPLTGTDILVTLAITVPCLLLSVEISRREDGPRSSLATLREGVARAAESFAGDDEYAPRVDPTPVTKANFFLSPGHWRLDALDEAMEGRGRLFEKPPRGATAAEIEETETRFGVHLPEELRQLYRISNGGYVGEMYVPAKPRPWPHNDWRGAFSIDYSSLAPLEKLRTVEEHYNDWTDDPDEIPADASRLIVLQARYGDMTLLDYDAGPEPRVLLVDFDGNGNLKDVAFDDFDSFFEQLRRPVPEKAGSFVRLDFRTAPLSSLPPDARPAVFWNGEAHRYANVAARTEGAAKPKARADDALIAETEARIGLPLPDTLKAILCARNGGGVAFGFLDWPLVDGNDEGHGMDGEVHLFQALAPAEYIATLGQLSDRVRFPAGETPWRDRVDDADRLVVLHASREASIILDYRAPGDPIVTRVRNLSEFALDDARSYDTFDGLIGALRKFKPSGPGNEDPSRDRR
ncbi:SMI1/KNR4 family protein [Aurantimonas endophytica]|uniref:Knr4/Smi1-like domain-containing protein n=1 Tax=Aurantimonas endophytica TaxID=1522175 RepID=A0A7W6HDI6_9HYPH|nr:SMI1/KNR4 family protein [Aurantimonas endophytica]MBB4003216.1 hypothetical protein [Aurantimonas endophytica]MCO6404080.1 hypothetical protein [Aurantimonas endophytica]